MKFQFIITGLLLALAASLPARADDASPWIPQKTLTVDEQHFTVSVNGAKQYRITSPKLSPTQPPPKDTYLLSLWNEWEKGMRSEWEAWDSYTELADPDHKDPLLNNLRKRDTVSGKVKRLGGHGADKAVKVTLDLPKAPFFWVPEDIPGGDIQRVKVGDRVVIWSVPNGDYAPYVIYFAIRKKE